jgi:hypothetical protein
MGSPFAKPREINNIKNETEQRPLELVILSSFFFPSVLTRLDFFLAAHESVARKSP